MKNLFQDVRYGLRMLRKTPGFTAVAVITLALGISSNTVIFSVVNAVLLHPTPYQDASQLVEISERNPQGAEDGVSVGDFDAWQGQTQAFAGVGAYERMKFQVLTGFGEPDEVGVTPLSPNLFRELGVSPMMGRTFAENEYQTAVISHQYWQTHFASDPNIIGKSFELDSRPYTVIGVAPADLEFPGVNSQIWIPRIFSATDKTDHQNHSLNVIARLQTKVSVRQAQAAMDLAAHRLAMQYPAANAGWTAAVTPFRGEVLSTVLRSAIMALLGAAILVLIIVCSNLTSMLFARGIARQGEMAIRAALGAGRMRLIRQLVIEAVLLAGTAGIVGLLLAWRGVATIASLLPRYNLTETQTLHRIAINLPVFGFAAALSLGTGMIVSLLPAQRLSSLRLNESLKQGSRTARTSARETRIQRALIVSEVALALVLLVGAGLMIQSLRRLETAPTGFNPDHLLTLRVPLVNYKYAPGQQSDAFYQSVLERVRAIPGVKAAGMANNLPFTGIHTTLAFPAPARAPGTPGNNIYVATRSVSPGYFHAMQISLLTGRDFTQADNQKDSRCVRIVNQALARVYWPGQNPVGQEIPNSCPKGAPASIVGVVADSKQNSVDSRAEAELYAPYGQFPFASFLVTFVVRTASNPIEVAAAVRAAVSEIDHDQPVIQVRTMEDVVAESIWLQHISALMLAIYAAIALTLSAIGIYGVLSYSVTRRTHEIGIRTALGAMPGDILRMVVGEGMVLTVIGLCLGTLAALGLTRLLATVLYDIGPRDPLTFVVLSLLLTGVALLACYVPARRAASTDPMAALRCE